MELKCGILLITLILYYSKRKRSLTIDGLIAAGIVGFITVLSGWTTCVFVLLIFFFTSSKLTKIKQDVKNKLDQSHKSEHEGMRNWEQVFSNSFSALIYCLLLYISDDKLPLTKYDELLLIGYIAHYGCCIGDTWASEVGILSKSPPILITTLRLTPSGTNGGVSLLGLTATLLAGVFLGIWSLLSIYLETGQWMIKYFWISICSALFGSLFDSLLGATLQPTYYSEKSTCVVSLKDKNQYTDIKLINGLDILTNNQVNLLSSTFTSTLIVLIMIPFI